MSGEQTPATGNEPTDRTGIEQVPAANPVMEVRTGMWGGASGTSDTSGYNGLARVVEFPGDSSRPYGGWFDAVADRMAELVPGFSAGLTLVYRGEITFFVRPEKLVELVQALRDDAQLRFESCASLTCVHYPQMSGQEMHVVYNLLSYTHNRRIRLEVALADPADHHPHLPSVVRFYPHADYQEREAWDMFGVIFDGHPALTRILMPDDWVGHPQRKDYPLGGIPVEYKGHVTPPPDERRSYN
ncbi:NADH-quinone oxidoreductase subunit C [Acidipropionibacterium jensenii]|uniref:NADH-quinone oxidoreductase subunit C n=1 Tax=Acidipropionibacterium jensenii TaxID=1749 RepID=A0A448P1K2_9ACTN|nr:NADH-quinone oxidoreductase subunit C/D [Acidipropionibacterium jensenii]